MTAASRRIAPRTLLLILFTVLLGPPLAAQEPVPILLWPNGAPGSEGKHDAEQVRLTELGEHIVSRVHQPSLTPYLPAAGRGTGTAVVVIPGGGHRELWMDHEGYRVGRWLAAHGVAAFVLKYRLAREPGSTYTVDGDELADVQRAIRLVRDGAASWGLLPDRIGVIGFSAGGELAALAGTRPDSGPRRARDPVDGQSSRPAFMGLVYPAIPRGMALSRSTPPAFLLCGDQDAPAIADSLPALRTAIERAGGSAELHILSGVGHGFGIRDGNPPAVALWPQLFLAWLGGRGLLGAPPAVTELSRQMRDGIPGARPVPVYSPAERARAAQRTLGLAGPPDLGAAEPLTPDAPLGPGGAHLSVWKPAFVLGTPGGGEIGVNFWGIHNQGHVNVGFTPAAATSYLLDCRVLSAGPVTYKVFGGDQETPGEHGVAALADGHVLLLVPVSRPGELLSVELWPTPDTMTLGFLGCDLSAIGH